MRQTSFIKSWTKIEAIIKKIQIGLLVVVAVLFLPVAPALADIICQNSADVSIDEWFPDENLNYKDRIIISTNKNIHHGIARGLFLFDIPEELTDADIRSASIYLSLCSHCGGGDGGNVEFCALNETFDEETDTWNTLNGGDWNDSACSQAVIPEGSTWNEAVNGNPPRNVEGLDITALLQGNLEKVRGNGILLKFYDEHQEPFTHHNIAAKESEDELDFPPYLIITTKEEKRCPAELIFNGDNETLGLLRSFRDQVLSQSLVGRCIIELYYHYASFYSSLVSTYLSAQP